VRLRKICLGFGWSAESGGGGGVRRRLGRPFSGSVVDIVVVKVDALDDCSPSASTFLFAAPCSSNISLTLLSPAPFILPFSSSSPRYCPCSILALAVRQPNECPMRFSPRWWPVSDAFHGSNTQRVGLAAGGMWARWGGMGFYSVLSRPPEGFAAWLHALP